MKCLFLLTIFVPHRVNGRLINRQIDHAVLLPTGLYIIETKYWRGKIIHGATEKNTKGFSFLHEMIRDVRLSGSDEQTFVFVPQSIETEEGQTNKVVSLKNFGNPARQVRKTAIQLKKFLEKHTSLQSVYVQGLVYFGYLNKGHNSVTNN